MENTNRQEHTNWIKESVHFRSKIWTNMVVMAMSYPLMSVMIRAPIAVTRVSVNAIAEKRSVKKQTQIPVRVRGVMHRYVTLQPHGESATADKTSYIYFLSNLTYDVSRSQE